MTAEHLEFIQDMMRKTGLTASALATKSGVSPSTLTNFIYPKLDKPIHERLGNITRDRVAIFCGYSSYAEYLIEKAGVHNRILLEGYVGVAQQVFIETEQELEWVPMPAVREGVDIKTLTVVRVRGDVMLPNYKKGYLLFYNKNTKGIAEECLNEWCAVQVKDGPIFVREVTMGYQKGLYNLISPNRSISENLELEWAAKIRTIVT